MVIYEMSSGGFHKIEEVRFAEAKLREREDLQRLLRRQIDIVCPDTLVISEEFSEWEDSGRRIDLLGVDKDANLVVIELKRTETGGHMELQAIRYAAMVSTMTFERATEVYGDFLVRLESNVDARSSLLSFLNWAEPDEDRFAQDVRIALIAADFSRELTTAVMWLNERGINIRCIRIKPYDDNGRILVDVQQILPLPEAEDYQVKIKEKQQRERAARESTRDFTKFDVTVGDRLLRRLPKRAAIFEIVQYLVAHGHSPDKIAAAVPWKEGAMFRDTDGKLASADFIRLLTEKSLNGGRAFDEGRYFCEDGKLLHYGGKTYAFTNQWGRRWGEAIEALMEAFPDETISCHASP